MTVELEGTKDHHPSAVFRKTTSAIIERWLYRYYVCSKSSFPQTDHSYLFSSLCITFVANTLTLNPWKCTVFQVWFRWQPVQRNNNFLFLWYNASCNAAQDYIALVATVSHMFVLINIH